MRTTIRMNEELARRAKAHAARTKRTFTRFVEEAVAEKLAREGKEAPVGRIELPPPVGDPSRKMTDEEYRAIIDRMYAEEAEHIIGLGRRGANGRARR